MICYFRDEFLHLPCPLERMGSDCCEEFFSKNMQFIGNHQVFPFGNMLRNVGHMIRLSQIQADPDAPLFARAYVKQENVWKKQFPSDSASATMQEYPVNGEEVSLWQEGSQLARDLATSLGMHKSYFDNHEYNGTEGKHDWFEKLLASGRAVGRSFGFGGGQLFLKQ